MGLQREIKKFMNTEEPKKKRYKNKTIKNGNDENLEHLNNTDRQFEPFLFGNANKENHQTKQSTPNGHQIETNLNSKSDRKRTFSEMNENENKKNKNNIKTRDSFY